MGFWIFSHRFLIRPYPKHLSFGFEERAPSLSPLAESKVHYDSLLSLRAIPGITQFIQIESEVGEVCVVKTDMPSPLAVFPPNTPLQTLGVNTYSLSLQAGETGILYSGSTLVLIFLALTIRPHSSSKSRVRRFGDRGRCWQFFSV